MNGAKSIPAKDTPILDDVGVALVQKRKSVSLGNNLRLESEKFMGAGLEFGDHIIQFSVFSSENGNGSGPRGRMRKAPVRRESRNR